LVRGNVVSRKLPQQISPNVETCLRQIEHWTSAILQKVAHTNPHIAHDVVIKSGVESRGATLSIDWRINPFEFLERTASILNLTYAEKKTIGGRSPLRAKAAAITNLISRIDAQADPVFILDPHFEQEPSLPWGHLGFLLAIAFFIIAALFPKMRAILG
jgi:hypothetical protein